MVTEKIPYAYGFPYWYGDDHICIVILRVCVLTYTLINPSYFISIK